MPFNQDRKRRNEIMNQLREAGKQVELVQEQQTDQHYDADWSQDKPKPNHNNQQLRS